MLNLKHSLMTLIVVSSLAAFGSACSEEDKAAKQMLQEAQTRLTALEAKAAKDAQCKTLLAGCRASMNACMPASTTPPPSTTVIQTCMSGFNTCIGPNCQ